MAAELSAIAPETLSIIIVSWNTRNLLADCLESVSLDLSTSHLSAEVVVVDNASHDGTADMVRSRFGWARLIANSDNLGFARANNQALRTTTGRYVLLLNPDTRLEPGALQTMVGFLDQHPFAGAIGSRLLNEDGSLCTSCQPAPTLTREAWRLFHLDRVYPLAVYSMDNWSPDAPRPVDVIQGASMLLRRSALERVGPLDEDYFIYSEEVDLCYRLRRSGWQIWWVPQATVLHYGGRSTRQVAAAMFLRLYQGKVLYFRKNHGGASASRYKLILAAAALGRLLVTPLAWLRDEPQRRRDLLLAGHYCRLLRALPDF
jgi:GT2 family glycosyltransferase